MTVTTGPPETEVTTSRIFNRGLLNLVEVLVNLLKINILALTEIV